MNSPGSAVNLVTAVALDLMDKVVAQPTRHDIRAAKGNVSVVAAKQVNPIRDHIANNLVAVFGRVGIADADQSGCVINRCVRHKAHTDCASRRCSKGESEFKIT